jgi:hypothetical protein
MCIVEGNGFSGVKKKKTWFNNVSVSFMGAITIVRIENVPTVMICKRLFFYFASLTTLLKYQKQRFKAIKILFLETLFLSYWQYYAISVDFEYPTKSNVTCQT